MHAGAASITGGVSVQTVERPNFSKLQKVAGPRPFLAVQLKNLVRPIVIVYLVN